METLDNDCLSLIFLNLDFINRIRLEHVCRQWYSVLQRQSTYCDITRLNIADFLFSTSTDYYQQESIRFTPTVVGVVERCGNYVKELTFGQRWLKISQPIVDCIARNCHRLRSIDLGAVILNADICELLANVASQLEELSLEETSWLDIDAARKIQDYFKDMKNLKRLNLRSAMFELDQLDQLTSKLRFLELSGARRFNETVFLNFLANQNCLEELNLAPAPVLNRNILAAIGQITSLKKLNLGFCHHTELTFDSLSGLVNLRTLRLECLPGLTERALRPILTELTQLNDLCIRKCVNVRDYSSLALCAQLESLEITDTMQFSDEDYLTLCTFGRLRRISFVNCLNLSTRGVNMALTRCQLKELTISRCSQVNDEMMYMLASTQRELEVISLQNCNSITSKGFSSLAWLRNVSQLREVDVSRNKTVDDSVVISLHNALTMAHRRDANRKYGRFDYGHKQDENTRMTMYIFDTSISKEVEKRVEDLINLC